MFKDTERTILQMDLSQAKILFSEAKTFISEKDYEEAIELLKKTIEVFETNEEWETFMEASNELATTYIKRLKFALTIQVTEYALHLLHEKCPHLLVWEVHLCTTKYKAFKGKRQSKDSFEPLIRAQQIIENEKIGEWVLIENLIFQATTYVEMRNYVKSRNLINRITELIDKTKNQNHRILTEFYSALAMLELSEGNFLLGKEFYEKAYNLCATKEDDPFRKMYFYFKVGIANERLGNRQKELSIYSEVVKIYEELYTPKLESPIKIRMGIVYSELGRCLCKLGDPVQGFHYYEKARNLYEKIGAGTAYYLLGNLSDISHLYADQKNYAKQLECCEKALGISQSVFKDDYENAAVPYRNLADAHRNLGDMNNALFYYEKALEVDIKIKGENHHTVSFNYLQLGYYWTINKGYSKGLEYLYKALSQFKRTDRRKHLYIVNSYYMIAYNFEEQGKLKTALEHYQLALTTLLPNYQETDFYLLPTVQECVFIEPTNLLDILLGKAITLYKSALAFEKTHFSEAVKTLKASLNTCQLAADYLQELHKTLKAEDSKLILTAKVLPIYEQAIKTILLLANRLEDDSILEKAFAFHELAKALLLRSSMQENEARVRVSIDVDLLEQEKDLKNQIETYLQKIQQQEARGLQKDKTKLKEWKENHFNELLKHQALIEQFERDYPEYYELKYNFETVSIPMLQNELEEDTVVISYFIGSEKGYIFAVTSDEHEMIPFEVPKDFDQQIQNYLNGIHAQNITDFIPQSHDLYFLLIEPISYLIFDPFAGNPKNLVILPSASLSYLPFETLIREKPHTAQPAFHQLDYLLQHCPIQYHYSATLYHQSLQKKAREISVLTSIEKPNSIDFLGFAPIYTSDKKATQEALRGLAEDYSSWATRSDALQDGTFAPLPFSEKEVQNIEELFTQKGLNGQSFLYNTATKEHFKTLASNAKYLHIAAHGLTNDEYPKLSGIVFHPTEEATEIHDSVLSMGEMYQLQLQADLVVLSSCESGIGKLAKGEGMMAINRGFLYAGAKNVIYTLFKVLDKPSSELCETLFEEILTGKTYMEALRLAKLRLIQREDIDPKSWSGFVLLGA